MKENKRKRRKKKEMKDLTILKGSSPAIHVIASEDCNSKFEIVLGKRNYKHSLNSIGFLKDYSAICGSFRSKCNILK